MRRPRLWLLCCLLTGLIFLSGCGGSWRFAVKEVPDEDIRYASDEAVMAESYVELPRLELERTRRTLFRMPPEKKAAVRDAFNEGMDQVRAQLAEELYELDQLARADYVGEYGEDFRPMSQRLELRELRRTDRLLSVLADGSVSWGGSRPWRYARCWSFDMERGVFLSWSDLSDEPDRLRLVMAEEILSRMDPAVSWFPEAEDRVRTLEGCQVYLGEEAMTLIFGEQQLCPRSGELPSFQIPYSSLNKYFSAYGRKIIKNNG